MSRIRTYARLRPPPQTAPQSSWYGTTEDKLHINIPEDENQKKFGRKGKVQHVFEFTRAFNTSSSQDEVFDTVTKDVVQSFLDGYNATVFAHGQTGSGKTHTIEGSYKKYCDRGIIPRALGMIYRALEERAEEDITVQISYLEIYQEIGYDLLNPGLQNDGLVTRLPKVTILQADCNNIIFKNLSFHLAANEEVARSLLFQGRTNRKVAETPMNKRSSRSHAVFTIYLTSKPKDSPVTVQSKLHLVDLAGSERVAKSKVKGSVLQEAKYINLSLHHLEHVIVALQRGSQHCKSPSRNSRLSGGHVPYRNSVLTTVLRDSLGGNCMTAMIATLSVEETNVWESISTCRFAQRVACIANPLRRNEVLDDKEVIKRLRRRIAELEAEVSALKQQKTQTDLVEPEEIDRTLSGEEKKLCHTVMSSFLDGRIEDPVASGVDDLRKFRECLRLLRDLVINVIKRTGQQSGVFDSLPADRLVGGSRSSSRTSGFNSAGASSDDTPLPVSPTVSDLTGHHRRTAWETPLATPSNCSTREVDGDVPLKSVSTSAGQNPKAVGVKPLLGQSSLDERRYTAIEKKTRKLEVIKQRQEQEKTRLTMKQLQMLEEDYQGKMVEVREQIASQHARIVAMRRQGAGDENIVRERLAEQQLQLKEGRIRQQLLGIRNQLTFEREANFTECSSLVETHDGNRGDRNKARVDARTVLLQLKKQEEEHNKIEQHLKEVRMSQMEQQLALKEEATRRKLQAFKQQLQSHQPHPLHQQTATQLKANPSQSTNSLSYLEQTASAQENSDRQRAAPAEYRTSHVMLAEKHVRSTEEELWKGVQQKYVRPQDMPESSHSDAVLRGKVVCDVGQMTVMHRGNTSPVKGSTLPDAYDYHNQAVVASSRSQGDREKIASCHLRGRSRYLTSNFPLNQSIPFDTVSKHHLRSKTTRNSRSQDDGAGTTPIHHDFGQATITTDSSSCSDETRAARDSIGCVRSIPRRDSERQYVSAAEKHKERVARIRKATKAAEVIQRAWKRYRRRTGLRT